MHDTKWLSQVSYITDYVCCMQNLYCLGVDSNGLKGTMLLKRNTWQHVTNQDAIIRVVNLIIGGRQIYFWNVVRHSCFVEAPPTTISFCWLACNVQAYTIHNSTMATNGVQNPSQLPRSGSLGGKVPLIFYFPNQNNVDNCMIVGLYP